MNTFGEYVTRVPCASSLTALACARSASSGTSRSSCPGISGRRYPAPENLRCGWVAARGGGGGREGCVHPLRRASVPAASGRAAVVGAARRVREGAARPAPQPVLPARRRRLLPPPLARPPDGPHDGAHRGGGRPRGLVRLLRRGG